MGRGDVKVRKFRYLNREKVQGDVSTHLYLLNALSTKDLKHPPYTPPPPCLEAGLTCEDRRLSQCHPRRM